MSADIWVLNMITQNYDHRFSTKFWSKQPQNKYEKNFIHYFTQEIVKL